MKKLSLPKLVKPKHLVAVANKRPVSPVARQIVQNWLPVQDISSGLLMRSDGQLVAAIRVEPAAFTLLSEVERARRITALHEIIQALPGAVQICTIPRPIDLDIYIADLEAQMEDVYGSRKNVLRGYVNYVRRLAANAEALERRFYLLMPGGEKKKGTQDELLQRVRELVTALERAELQAHICSDQEVLDLLFCFFHPAQAAFERAVIPAAAPVYTTAKDVMQYGLD